jgi:RNA ligase
MLKNLSELIANGTIKATRHPTAPLTIYNYTAVCQYEQRWCDTSRACRGLILHDDGSIVARPFPKFHNSDEHPRSDIVFSKPFTITEKLDGSLGILYHDGSDYAIATRGSFTSSQARKATELLRSQYSDFQPQSGITYLFEIIFPGNRIVVDYGEREELVLLAVLETESGRDVDLPNTWPGSVARTFDVQCRPLEVMDSLALTDDGNNEGVVLRFDWPKTGPQTRVKVKLAEYKRLHKLIFMTTTKTVWEALSTNSSLEEMLDRVPDEFHAWLRDTISQLETSFAAIDSEARRLFAEIVENVGADDRKAFAELATKSGRYAPMLFKLLDGLPIDQIIWKQIRPEFAKPFKSQSEDVA